MDNQKFTFNCPYCGQPLEAEIDWVGLECDCIYCGKTLQVPPAPLATQTKHPVIQIVRQMEDEMPKTKKPKNKKRVIIAAASIIALCALLSILLARKSKKGISRNAYGIKREAAVVELTNQKQTINNIEWTYSIKNDEVSIKSVPKTTSGDISIPVKIDGYPVRRISDFAFDGCSGIAIVIIPDGIVSLGKYSFANCSNLIMLSIGKNVASIEDRAFEGCTRLKYVGISDLAAWCNISFGFDANPLQYAKYFSTDGPDFEIKNLVIPNGVTQISDRAFLGCGITSVVIPDSVTDIGNFAFHRCRNLESATIGKGVKNIGERAFDSIGDFSYDEYGVTIVKTLTLSIPKRLEAEFAKRNAECERYYGYKGYGGDKSECEIIVRPPSEESVISQEISRIDVKKAKELYQQGIKYYNGDGVLQDYKEAFRCLSEAAELGCIAADAQLAGMCITGRGCEQNTVKGIFHAEKAANSSSEANRILGIVYFYGSIIKDGVFPDAKKAYEHFCASDDFTLSLYVKGLLEFYGKGTEKDELKAANSFYDACKKMPSDNKEAGEAAMCLGQLYYKGLGVSCNYEEAWKWFKYGARTAFPDLVKAAKTPLTREDIADFNRNNLISFTPYSWKMAKLYHGKGKLNAGVDEFDLLEQALATYFNPDLWVHTGIKYSTDNM